MGETEEEEELLDGLGSPGVAMPICMVKKYIIINLQDAKTE